MYEDNKNKIFLFKKKKKKSRKYYKTASSLSLPLCVCVFQSNKNSVLVVNSQLFCDRQHLPFAKINSVKFTIHDPIVNINSGKFSFFTCQSPKFVPRKFTPAQIYTLQVSYIKSVENSVDFFRHFLSYRGIVHLPSLQNLSNDLSI